MRTQANGLGQPRAERAAALDDETLPVWRAIATLRTRLWPYLAAAARDLRPQRLPLMRHAALTDPGDAALVARDDQYLLGPDLLAAPVLEPGRPAADAAPAGRDVGGPLAVRRPDPRARPAACGARAR